MVKSIKNFPLLLVVLAFVSRLNLLFQLFLLHLLIYHSDSYILCFLIFSSNQRRLIFLIMIIIQGDK